MRFEVRELLRLKLDMQSRPGFQAAFSAIYDQIAVLESATTGATSPSQTMIAAALGYARETVCRGVGWLRRQGYLRTKQRMIRQADGSVLHGPLLYWISRDAGQAAHLRQRIGLRERYQQLLARGQLRSTFRANSRCDVEDATPPRPVNNLERKEGSNEISVTSALQRVLNRWAGKG